MNWKKYNSPRILTSILDDSRTCGLWGNRASLPSKVWDALTWPTPPKIFVPGHYARIQEFLSGGGGSRLLNLFYSLKRGSNGFITHFPGGGGSNFFQGWESNRNPYNYNLWFSRGVWTAYPPLDPHIDIVAFWHE